MSIVQYDWITDQVTLLKGMEQKLAGLQIILCGFFLLFLLIISTLPNLDPLVCCKNLMLVLKRFTHVVGHFLFPWENNLFAIVFILVALLNITKGHLQESKKRCLVFQRCPLFPLGFSIRGGDDLPFILWRLTFQEIIWQSHVSIISYNTHPVGVLQSQWYTWSHSDVQ